MSEFHSEPCFKKQYGSYQPRSDELTDHQIMSADIFSDTYTMNKNPVESILIRENYMFLMSISLRDKQRMLEATMITKSFSHSDESLLGQQGETGYSGSRAGCEDRTGGN